MKLLNFVKNNILLLFTLFLLAFIPLYPKLPVIGVKHTWVYIRLEDFLVVVSLAAYGVQLLRRKATLKTPLTIPIFIYWGVGLVSTLFAIFFIFPHIINVFPTVAGLFYLRTIEYISVFFLAFSAVRKSINLPLVTGVLAATLLGVVGYGFGQKLYGFPAYLTMNEEFAKGIPLKLSDAARIPSTFAGHYDLAAYLILLIPLLGSMIFGFKNWFAKLFLFTTSALGLILLLMTASRVSFVVYLAAVTFLLILQKQKKFILPVIIASLLLLHSFQGLSQRFSNTISQVDLVVDARTGKAIGVANPVDNTGLSKSNTTGAQPKQTVVIKDVQSTGENLPHGSSYINLPSSSTNSIKNITQLLYQRSVVRAGTTSAEVTNIQGDFAVKKVLAYDVSFTTRFQGEWPRAIEAFQRNILLGSGPSSISLSTDNNYLRILGETGILGFASFVLIFLIISIYAYRVLPSVQSKAAKSLILGVLAGIFGLGLNAILIDVFVASKVAFVLWLLLGLTIGLLHAYQKNKINYLRDLRLVLFSTPAVASYFLVLTFGIFSVIFNNYFVGDDFTWLRWAAECDKLPAVGPALAKCVPVKTTLMNYFLHSDGFFYRPGMKLYFFGMYSLFWINAVAYHVVSIIAHFIVTILLFLVARRIFKSAIFGFIAALFFLVLSGHSETIFWIASIGHLLAAIATVLALVLFIEWKETKKFFFL
ncbi:MAG TPA: hypothetical protein VLF68_01485, partial [Candidatus Saccharimonadales bacterium]|nr:hypothetical protein [Candidatus Saccharimonadales bacterium]